MPEPVWLQEIRDRAEAATPGPWRVVAHGEQDCLARREITAGKHIMIARVDCVPGVAADFDRDYAFIAHSRTDVPRLIALVGEMAEKLEGAVTVLDDIAAYGYDISKVPNIVKEAILGRQALAKYHGEAEPTTPNESYWWCESCGCEVDGTRVTYEELHDVCGHPVEWREGDDER
jgi:hypothetical protein